MMATMSRSWSRKIIFIVLAMFCGQVVAAPFLDCRGEMIADWEKLDHQIVHVEHDVNEHAVEHSPNPVSHNEQDGHMGHQHNANDNMSMSSSDCDCSCDVCFGVAPIHSHLSQTFLANQSKLLNNFQFFLPAFTLENPFRPPIFT